MADDLYSPPAFQLYVTDLIADTTDVSNEELGIYVRLLCRQWMVGSIPSDIPSMARIANNIPAKKMASAWKIVERFFTKHEATDANKIRVGLSQKRLEKERSLAYSRYLARVENGRKGGRPPHEYAENEEPSTKPQLKAKVNDSFPLANDQVSFSLSETQANESTPNTYNLIPKEELRSSSPSAAIVRKLPLGPRPEHLASDRLLAEVLEFGHDIGVTKTDWKKRNVRAIKSLIDGGHTPDEIVAMLRVALYHPAATYYRHIDSAQKLADKWSALSRIANGAGIGEAESDPAMGLRRI